MAGYFDRGASAGGHDEGYQNRDNITGPEGAGSAIGGPGGLAREDWDLEVDPDNPNIVRAVPGKHDLELDETAGSTSTARTEASNPNIIEGSDSARTGTSTGIPGVEDATTVESPRGATAEGEAHPNRNTGRRPTREELDDVGAWSTMGTSGSPGSPTGNS